MIKLVATVALLSKPLVSVLQSPFDLVQLHSAAYETVMVLIVHQLSNDLCLAVGARDLHIAAGQLMLLHFTAGGSQPAVRGRTAVNALSIEALSFVVVDEVRL